MAEVYGKQLALLSSLSSSQKIYLSVFNMYVYIYVHENVYVCIHHEHTR